MYNYTLMVPSLISFLHWTQQYNILGLEWPDQLPDVSPGRLQWSLLGCHKPRVLQVALYLKVDWILMLNIII